MKKLLLVEDDQFLLSLLEHRLKKKQVKYSVAQTGDEALKAIKKHRPDVILLDIILPNKSGFEVLSEMRSDPQFAKTTVIIISNLGQPEDIQQGRALGAKDYLVKSDLSLDDVIKKVRKYLPPN